MSYQMLNEGMECKQLKEQVAHWRDCTMATTGRASLVSLSSLEVINAPINTLDSNLTSHLGITKLPTVRDAPPRGLRLKNEAGKKC